MINYFDEFTDTELTYYEQFDFEPNEEGGLYNVGLDIHVYKKDDKFYVRRDEDEPCFQEQDGRIYVMEPVWYMHVNLELICVDYADGLITINNLDIESYEQC